MSNEFAFADDAFVLATAVEYLENGHAAALVTVLKTWGSAPRPVGSLLVMRSDGVHCGSVSGGCVEEDLFTRYANNELNLDAPCILDYGVNREQAGSFGLPCGGRLELLVEKLATATPLNIVLKAIKEGRLLQRSVCLHTGEVSLHPLGDSNSGPVEDSTVTYNTHRVSKIFGPQWRLFLVGAGHLSHYVAKMAALLDYAVIVCEPREEYRLSWQLPQVPIITEMPDDAVVNLGNIGRTAVITLTHDPKLDDMALLEALVRGFFYVGALGSQKTSQNRKDRLRQMGLSEKQVELLRAPVGLPIGSHRPAEIAIAIMAEITALRNHVKPNIVDVSVNKLESHITNESNHSCRAQIR